jgi:1-acyl-sn-glycerol-3-phosphate acyltransferase
VAKNVLGDNPFSKAPGKPDGDGKKARPAAPTGKAGRKEAKRAAKKTAAAAKKPKKKAPVVEAPTVAAAPLLEEALAVEATDADAATTPTSGSRNGSQNGAQKRGERLTEPPSGVYDDAGYGDGATQAEPEPQGDDEEDADALEYGADAAVRTPDETPEPGGGVYDYGPSLDRTMRAESERRGLVDEFRQIERFIRDRVLPLAPGGSERRKLPLEFLWRRWRDLAMMDRSDFVDEFGRDPMYTARVEPMLDFLYRRYFRVEVIGMENIPAAGRALIVANHSGTLPYDGAMVMHAVKRDHPAHRDVRPLVEDFVFHFPYLGTFINRVGGVRACQENAERLLVHDQLAAVFPEGIKGIGKLYAERYKLQRFGRGGFIKLALRTDSPIIPTAIVGAEEIHPMIGKVTWLAKSLGLPYIPITPTFPWLGPLGALPLPSKWTIKFGAPLYFNAEYGREGADDRILVNRLSENVRSSIQEMVEGILSQRKTVLFG